MNQALAALKRWRIQIFAITWLAYAAFYFTRKAFSVAKLGIAEDPTFMLDKAAMANLDAIYLAAYAVGQFTWGMLADRFGPRVVVLGGLLISAAAAVVMGSFATFPVFATCMLVQGLAQSTGWAGLCKNIGSFFPASQRGRVLGCGVRATPSAAWSLRRSPAGGPTPWSAPGMRRSSPAPRWWPGWPCCSSSCSATSRRTWALPGRTRAAEHGPGR